jgi:hypothetical protein
MDTIDMAKTEDRRRFFRIGDELNLFYKRIDEKQANEVHRIPDNILTNCSLATALEMVSQDSAVLLRRLDKTLPEVADYFRLIETKIDLIGQAIVMQGCQIKENDTRNVTVSATGLAFECEEALKKGEYLEIRILLVSSMEVIVTYGKVIHCKNSSAGDDSHYPYVVGVNFINMKDEDRELLSRYVIKKQLQQIRDKKQVNTPS